MNQNEQIVARLRRQFNADAYDMADKAFGGSGISRLRLLDTIHSFYAYLDGFLTQFEKFVHQQGENIDCKKGCASCCYQAVFMSPFEALYLAENIRKFIPKDQQSLLIKRVEEKREATKGMSASEYLAYRHICPLLDEQEGACMLHQYRPVACRIYLSGDVKSCIKQHENPGNEKIFAKLYDLPLQTGRAYCEGLNQYFLKYKLGIQEVKFEDALYRALVNEESMDEWLNGGKLFITTYTEEDFDVFRKFSNQKGIK